MNGHHHAVVGNIVGWMLFGISYVFGGLVAHLGELAGGASLLLSLVLLYETKSFKSFASFVRNLFRMGS